MSSKGAPRRNRRSARETAQSTGIHILLSYLRLLEGTQKNSKKTKGLQRKTQGDLSEKKSIMFIVMILDGKDGVTIF